MIRIEFKGKLDEYDIPMRENIVLEISRDDASELLISLIEAGWNNLYDKNSETRARYFLSAGIAYRLFQDSEQNMINGIRVRAKSS
jgi:hypothetical protein